MYLRYGDELIWQFQNKNGKWIKTYCPNLMELKGYVIRQKPRYRVIWRNGKLIFHKIEYDKSKQGYPILLNIITQRNTKHPFFNHEKDI